MSVRNMTRELGPYCAAAVLASFAALPSAAAEQRHPCTAIAEAAARLACYDAAFGAPAVTAPDANRAVAGAAAPAAVGPAAPVAPAAASAAAVAGSAAVAAPAPTQSATEQFGFHGGQPQPVVAKPAPEAGVDSIDSVINQVTRRPTGELIVALENGQVWMQLEADSTVRLKPGDAVTIRKAALGSYKLVSGPNATRVRRTK